MVSLALDIFGGLGC